MSLTWRLKWSAPPPETGTRGDGRGGTPEAPGRHCGGQDRAENTGVRRGWIVGIGWAGQKEHVMAEIAW